MRVARCPGLVVLILCGLVVPARAASPRDELLRLVPEDVGFCLVVEDLRGHSETLVQSPFVGHLLASPIGAALRSAPEVQKLAGIETFLQGQLQVSWARLRDDIFGDAVVFTYRPGPPGKPEQEEGVLLLRARDPQLLADLIQRVNDLQKQSGDLQELAPIAYEGATYYRKVDRKETNYYYLRGPVLVFSGREEAVRRTIDLDRQAEGAGEPPLAQRFRRLGLENCLLGLWVNPRAFRADLEHKAAGAKGPEAVALQTLLGYWKALDDIGLAAALRQDVRLLLVVRARTEAFPEAARRLLAAASQASELWARFPEGALLVVACRVDAPSLVAWFADFLTPEARKVVRDAVARGPGAMLGKDVGRDLVPNLGPDFGLCVAAPPAGPEWFPHLLAVARVRPGGEGVPADASLLGAINSFAMLAVLAYNRDHDDQMSLRSERQDKVEVKYLVNDRLFPPGLRPAFALKDGYLLLASSPEAVRRFGAASSIPSTGEVPLLRASLRGLARYLKDRLEPLAADTATRNAISRDEADRRLQHLLAVLELFDRLEVSVCPVAGQATFALRVRTAQPLK